MLQHGQGHRLDIVRRDEVAPGHGGGGAPGHDQRLGGARPSPHQHALMLPRSPDDIHQVTDQFVADHDSAKLLAQVLQILWLDDRLYGATGEQGFRID